MITFDEAVKSLASADGLLLLTHRKPDGDTLGSAAALCLGLRQLGKEAYLLKNPDTTPRYQAMAEPLWAPEGYEPSFVCAVDVAADNMLPKVCPQRIDLAIDHHPTHRQFSSQYYCEGDSAACGEIIYNMLLALGCQLTKDIADAVYTAVSTDTGCFRYVNTTTRSHLVAAKCMEAGADSKAIDFRCFRLKTRGRVAVEGHLYSTMELFSGGKGSIAVITRDDIARMNATDDDLDNLSTLLSEIEGVVVGSLLTETADRKGYKVSMRSGSVNVAEICGLFDGGGHPGAAGCTVFETEAKKAAAMIRKAVEDRLNA